jgi:hypothetical protein
METIPEIKNQHERSVLPERVDLVLYLECYQKGLRSAKEINKKLSARYNQPINLSKKEICDILTKRAQMFNTEHFNPKEITE